MVNEKELIKSAEEKGVMILGLSKSFLNKVENSNTIFLGYANLKYNEMEEAIILLKEAWHL